MCYIIMTSLVMAEMFAVSSSHYGIVKQGESLEELIVWPMIYYVYAWFGFDNRILPAQSVLST